MGPGTRLPSLGAITFAELRDDYQVQAAGLLEGGTDVLLVETVYDLLQAKAAIVACRRAMADAGRTVPLMVQVTMETTGRMLVGSEIGAAVTALEAMKPDVLGLNCATGPDRDDRAPPLPQGARAHVPLVPAERGPAVGRRRSHALRPHPGRPRRRARALRHRVRHQHRRRLLRHHARAPARGRRAARSEPGARSRATRTSSPAARASTRTSRTTRSSRTSRSASAPTPTAPGSSATRCSKATGTPACRWPASR